MVKLLTLFNILLFSPALFAINQDCLNLFKSKGFIPGTKNCLMNCAIVDIDMGTFTCPISVMNTAKIRVMILNLRLIKKFKTEFPSSGLKRKNPHPGLMIKKVLWKML